jgi:SagB-type dehydrogenase family enzyme
LEQAREALAYAFRPEGAPWCLAPGRLGFHVVALDVEGLEPGVYDLDPSTLRLALRRSGDFRSETYFMCLGQDLASECAFALVHTADLAALAEAYGDRGYRYACMDAGQIGERLNLWAVHQGLGSSGIGGYYDDQANELLEAPLAHGILYISLVGVPEGE